MRSYTVGDVERVLQLSRSTVRSLVDGGFVKPARGRRREYLFSFQDMIVLRAARALIESKVSRKRIHRSLAALRRGLPETLPLSGLSISAVGDQVVVREGRNHWQAEDRQYVLGLDVSLEGGVLHMVEHEKAPAPVGDLRPSAAAEKDSDDWFNEALQLESADPKAAAKAYEQSVQADPENCAAWINWGRLLHDQGRTVEADEVYRRALEKCGPDPVLMFNLGVLLEDLGRTNAALEAYQTAVTEDPSLADGHYNLARLYETLGKAQHAIRHFGQYRRLVTDDR